MTYVYKSISSIMTIHDIKLMWSSGYEWDAPEGLIPQLVT